MVVVDVLRFTTAVDAGVSRGATVFPYRWKDASAQAFAASVGAVLADPRDGFGPSLSPISLLSLNPGDRVVLPSPNGSTCAALARDAGATVVAACLRNASQVGSWLNKQAGTVTVIACGERWSDGSLRPALEDYLGAGAVIRALHGTRSPEAEAAAVVGATTNERVADVVASRVSSKELVAKGRERDLAFALAVGASKCVPILRDGGFIDAISS